MPTVSRPQWMRFDVDMLDHPKLTQLQQSGGDSAVLLYIRGLSYATKHLTDGWIPVSKPKHWGFRGRHTQALEDAGLWIPLEITDDGGWIIHDYPQYQVTRAEWESMSERRRKAAHTRWKT